MPPVLHDMDGDGIDDAAVLLAESSGGSGAFTYLAVVSCRDGRAVNTGTIGLGDRVMIRSLGGQEGSIVVEFVAAGPGEPLCCPTRNVRNRYRLRDGNLLLASSEVQGALSLADVKGIPWRLSRLGRNERVPEGVKVTACSGKAGSRGRALLHLRLDNHRSESSAGGEPQMPGLIQLGETFRFIPATHPTETRRVTS